MRIYNLVGACTHFKYELLWRSPSQRRTDADASVAFLSIDELELFGH
ncbi:MAG: hypothetical protein HC847_09740 [Hydrococcus sp. RU_2_2]|nr:hypothetical protein [Hydrococcus sp. RU_2_2]NJP18165.1 hypothetical protein [Hydrococcus sp. CRU_1_1]NJQ97045.1 hypothetical protein [Hydrococcus sp. CSU_1_8]